MEHDALLPGIYNYCDRWCERCRFAEQCRIGRDELGRLKQQTSLSEPVERSHWQRVQESFEEAFAMIAKIADEMGVDFEALEPPAERLGGSSQSHSEQAIAQQSLSYTESAEKALKHYFSESHVVSMIDAWAKEFSMGVKSEAAVKEESRALYQAREVIGWYHMFIHVKIARCLTALEVLDHDGDQSEFAIEDRDISGRLALLGIERSMVAWKQLYDFVGENEVIEDFLIQLGCLRVALLRLAPSLASYRLPYFESTPASQPLTR